MCIVTLFKTCEEIERTAVEIQKLTGMSLEELQNLLVAGYTVVPPKKNITMKEVNELLFERERQQKKKNKRRVSVLITAQTLWHLEQEAKKEGHKDIGKVMDALTKRYLREHRQED